MKTNFSMPVLDTKYLDASTEVLWEIVRARALHPGDFHNIHEGHSVVEEEYDEFWDAVKLNPKKIEVSDYGDLLAAQKARHKRMMREEAIQLAAMAIRFAAELT